MTFYGDSDIGNIRKHNEDSYTVKRLGDDCLVAVIADGMGGHRGGKKASETASETAFEIISHFPQQDCYKSVSIPTWLYGHEPSTPFATHIAKLFENALREDGLLTIAKGGVVYAPGSAGTMQEVFQDAVQNHYLSFGYSSPMIFLGIDYWSKTIPVYNLLTSLSETKKYKNLQLSITDDVNEIVKTLFDFY